MATIRRHYDALRKVLGAVMILYLLFLGVQFALAMRDGAQAQQTDRIEQLERRLDRLDHELERVDAAQRLTRIETYIETTKEAQAANRQMFLLILATLTLILVGVILLLVGRGPRGMNSPPARGADFNAAVAVVLGHEGGYLEDHTFRAPPGSASGHQVFRPGGQPRAATCNPASPAGARSLWRAAHRGRPPRRAHHCGCQ